MNRPPPPLNFIRSFECAARHLSFTKAAQELGYTQAAISTHVRALEKYVGRDLFVRGARNIELTEMGEAFLPTLRQALSQIDQATDAIAMTSRDRSVVVACPMSLAENWLPGCVAAFRADHPDVEVVVHGTVWEQAADGIADIVISVNRQDEVPPGAQRLWDETLSLVCAPAMAARIDDAVALARVPKIIVSGRQEYWALLAEALGRPLPDSETAIRTNGSNIALEAAAQGLGAAIALTTLCRTYVARGILVEPLDLRPPSPWTYYVAARHGLRSPPAKRFHEHILSFGGAG